MLILIADDTISFLVSWEMMSIASYLLVNFEYERDESSHAGFVMLAMSEAGTIAVVDRVHSDAGQPPEPWISTRCGRAAPLQRRDRLGYFPTVVLWFCR